MLKEEPKIIKHGDGTRMSESMRQEFMQKVLLGHCECGMPEKSLRYLQNLLTLLKDSAPPEALDEFFHQDEGLKYTVYYMLHKYRLTDHREVVPGKLTEDGYNLLEELNKLYPSQ